MHPNTYEKGSILYIIIDYIIFVGKCVYTTLPGIIANMAPLFVKDINFLTYPLDFGIKIKGEVILGPRKTFRGLLAGIVFAMAVMYLQYCVYRFSSLKDLTLYDFEKINFHLLGFLFGFGVIFGDIFESFVKRRLNMPPGQSLIPWDQLDCVLGGLTFGRIAWAFPLKYGITIIILTFFIHIIGRHVGYYLGFCETKW